HSNNRIPPEGVIRLAVGLRANKTIKSLNVGRNPIQNAGCYGLLKSISDNKDSAVELLDLSDIFVNQDFEDLLESMRDTFPALVVKRGRKFAAFCRVKSDKTS
uniref:Leucine rich repeat containing 74B n=1 Tax=Periophthalmus magnuspinnatus TaxID=409849 RepID=A0A3B4A698_9GOBI